MRIQFGSIFEHMPHGLFIFFYVLLTAINLFPQSCAFALGEEIGWRGFLVPELYKTMSFTKTAIISGTIWALWHFPIIIFSNYKSTAPLWYNLCCFSIFIILSSFFYAWIRLKTNSVWTAVFFHASTNLFVQQIFDPLTIHTKYNPYFTGEFGIGLIIPSTILAIYAWIKKHLIKKSLFLNSKDHKKLESPLE